MVAEAAAWLRARDRRRPFFLWLHLADAHPPRPGVAGAGEALERYAAAVRKVDRAFGELTVALRRERLFPSTFVAVVADHGEGLGEHGEPTHGLALYDSTLRVPLMLGYPDGYGASEESSEVVSLVDVGPTLLDAMGIERDAGEGAEHAPDGVSLYYQSVGSDRAVYFESFDGWDRFGWSPLVGAADARGKLVRGAREELFDLREDPGEVAPKATSDGAPERYLAAIESAWGRPGPAPLPARAVDPDWLARLAALGHEPPAGSSSARTRPAELAGRTDPRDALEDHRRFERARRALEAGGYVEALVQLEELRAKHPGATLVLEALAEALTGAGRHAEAVDVLRSRLTLPPETVENHAALRAGLARLGEAEAAREHSVRSLELLVERQRRRGDVEGVRRARMLLERTRRQRPNGSTDGGSALEPVPPTPQDAPRRP